MYVCFIVEATINSTSSQHGTDLHTVWCVRSIQIVRHTLTPDSLAPAQPATQLEAYTQQDKFDFCHRVSRLYM